VKQLPIVPPPVHRVLNNDGRIRRNVVVGRSAVFTLPSKSGLVCGGADDGRNHLSLLRVLTLAKGAPPARFFPVPRADGVNSHP
jgi:hypothetical protein